MTRCFFLASRAVTLGVAAELHHTVGMDHRPHRAAAQVGWDHDLTRAMLAEVVAREAALASDSVVDDLQAFSACQCRWLLRLSDDDLRRCPEFLLEDACTIPCELNSMKPDTLRRSNCLLYTSPSPRD